MEQKKEQEMDSFIRAYLSILIINPKAKEADRREDRLALVKIMKRGEIFRIQDRVALAVMDALHRVRVGHHDEDVLYNLLAILLGNNGHGVKFAPYINGEISKIKKARRWRELSPNSPSRILLGK